jgi:hypothetical protein
MLVKGKLTLIRHDSVLGFALASVLAFVPAAVVAAAAEGVQGVLAVPAVVAEAARVAVVVLVVAKE